MKTVVKRTFFSTLKNLIISNNNNGGEIPLKKNILMILCFCIFIISACQNMRNNISGYYIENSIERLNRRDNTVEDIITAKGSIQEFNRSYPYNIPDDVERINNHYFDIGYNKERANRIAKLINDFPEVNKTTVIITGNTALIGIDTVHELDKKEIERLKRKIEEKVYSTDLSLKNIGISTSPEIINRMNKITNSINNMKSIDGLANELSSIIREIVPNV